ncbi:chemotaxis protein CheW [Thalassotalea sp. M1531]|uniref:Chemotaxis protein CheW n=1 Tax=Thalassotalea algicola TaxID=2716224 RepID=A0A7Y0LEG7_9GAMM|nr:chemotaxis protein CheW [Thalassotalea algicola]NMP32936.1 chemotaxis protein CheW [Thalassotalea algicola]
MSKSLAASQKVMKSYLSELLTDESEQLEHKEPENQKLEKLLENVTPTTTLPIEEKVTTTKAKAKVEIPTAEPPVVKKSAPVIEEAPAKDIELQTIKSQKGITVEVRKDYREGSFQAMFFEVAGLTIAVPLIELGGIHNVEPINNLMGKPNWFKGVMLHREEKINVVDTAQWVMPEKCDDKLKDSLNYQYIIMLSNSQWGLMAETLVDTVTLEQSDVKWMENSHKRPWLAGLVKDRMCALLDVDALITLLDKGLDVYQA